MALHVGMVAPPIPKLLFCTAAYGYLADEFQRAGGFDLGSIERKTFPDGERYLRVIDDAWGRDVVLVGGTPTDLDWLEVYDLGCAISRAGARSLSVVMPYMGYSTMERALRLGEVVTAKSRARLISAIPSCEGGTRDFFFDLHTDGVEFYFGDSHVTHHVHGGPVIMPVIEELAAGRPYVLGATDAGRAKWVEHLAQKLGAEPAFVYKRRSTESGELVVTGVNADVAGKVVIIYDDMIRTGSSLIQAAAAYRQAGAVEIHAVATHLVLPGDSLQRLLDSGLIASVNGTSSHPASQRVAAAGGRVVSMVALLVRAVERS